MEYTEKEIKDLHKKKAQDSFKTKKNLYLFDSALNRKTSIDLQEFREFKITDDLLNQYTGMYWQYEKDEYINDDLTIGETERLINELTANFQNQILEMESDYVNIHFSEVFPLSDFRDLIKSSECAYCGITEDKVIDLSNKVKIFKKHFRGWKMEIDRMHPNKEYSEKNCVMACYWCNNAKTDEFSFEEFQGIGQAIAKVWKSRLK